MSNGVFAVIVTYHPDVEQLRTLIEELNSQVEQIFVVDNGSEPEVLSWLSTQDRFGKIRLKALGRNFGLAFAQNQGIEQGKSEGAEFVLLVDQDSLPFPDMVAQLQIAALSLSNLGHRVAAVGPVHVEARDAPSKAYFLTFERFPPTKRNCSTNSGYVPADQLLSSGMLIPIAAIEAVGLMDEAFFIDQIDTDWCLRARSKGMSLYGVCGAKLIHAIGLGNVRIWIGSWRTVATHLPIRNYYFIRNSLVLLGRRHSSRYWRAFTFYLVVKWLVRTVFLPPRLLRIRLISKGMFHALIHRLGTL